MKINKKAKKLLKRAYNNLAKSINTVAELQQLFVDQLDPRYTVARDTSDKIMEAQGVLNTLAQDEDIRIV